MGTVYWSGLEEIQCSPNVWVSGKNSITLSAGTYIIIGHVVLPEGSSNGTI